MILAPLSLAVALGSAFQTTSTHCQTTDVPIVSTIVDRQLVGCGPQYSENVLWNLDRADGVSDDTAKRRTTGAGVVIYIIDSGVEQSHDEFQRAGATTNVIAGLDPYRELGGSACTPADTAVHPCFQQNFSIAGQTHGTACASVAAGRNAGVAPDASIVSVRVFGIGNSSAPPQQIFNRALDDIVKHAFDPATPPFRTAVVSMSAS